MSVSDISNSSQIHEPAPGMIVSLSWLFIIFPVILVILGIVWVLYRFGSNDDIDIDDDDNQRPFSNQKEQEQEQKKHHLLPRRSLDSVSINEEPCSPSPWRVTAPVSSTPRASITKPQSSSSKSPISPSNNKPIVGSKMAKIEAANRERVFSELNGLGLEEIDKFQLHRLPPFSSSTTSRKDD